MATTKRGSRFEDLTGKTFGRLTVIKEDSTTKHGTIKWLCRCECGNEKSVMSSSLRSGHTKSCGCFNKEQTAKSLSERRATHRMTRTRFYRIWYHMKRRCYDSKVPCYKYYGGRGIGVCEKWHIFENFFADMYESYMKHVEEFGERNTTLDKIDNNSNYSKSNCRWATWHTQRINQRRMEVSHDEN